MSHAKQLHNQRYFDDYLEIINRTGLPGNVKSEVCQHVHHAVIATVQRVIEQALEEELTTYLCHLSDILAHFRQIKCHHLA